MAPHPGRARVAGRDRKGPRKKRCLRLPLSFPSSARNVHHWKILCDFDGTVSALDATDELLARFAGPQWEHLERQWRNGAIGSRECMSRQIALIDASAREIDAVLDGIAIDPAFPRFVDQACDLDLELVIVSDGLDRAIHRILDNNHLDHLPVVANRLEHVGERSWRMQSPHADADCRVQGGTCKCACACAGRSGASVGRPNVLLIGDGQSDICLADRADFVFAKDRLLSHCLEAGIPHRAIGGFDDVIALLPELIAGRLDEDASRFLSTAAPSIQFA